MKKPIFTTLKKLITILTILLAFHFTASAQVKQVNDAGEPASRLVKFYPNPATSVINFELPKVYGKSYSIQLFNFMGKKVAESILAAQRISFNLDALYRGVYIYQLRDQSGKVIESGKFQVVKY